MRNFFSPGLKGRLVILILLAFIPAFSLSVYSSINQLHLQEAAARNDNKRMARLMQLSQHQALDAAKEFLTAASRFPVLPRDDAVKCRMVLNRINQNFSEYLALGLAQPDGNVFCTSDPVRLRGNIANRPFFKDTIAKRALGISPFSIDTVTGKPIVWLGTPIFSATDQIEQVLYAALDLSKFNDFPLAAQLPSNSVIMIFDQAGLILSRYPDPYQWTGTYQPNAALLMRVNANMEEGLVDVRGPDGIERVFAYTRLHQVPEQTVFLAVGISGDAAYGVAREAFYVEMFGLAIVSVVALGIAWFGSDKLILRKMRQVIDAADRIRNGDLGARSGLESSRDEVDRLAHAVDGMADAIQDRVTTLQRRDLDMSELRAMNDALQACMTQDEVLAMVLQFGKHLFPDHAGILYLLHESGDLLEAKAVWGSPTAKAEFQPRDCWALRRGRIYHVDPDDDQPRCLNVSGHAAYSYLCLPLLTQGEILGVLYLEGRATRPSQEVELETRSLAESMAEHVTLTLSNLKLRDTLHAQAVRDVLTGLFNRRYLEETLIRETRNADRTHATISIIMLDIDHFKRFNDTFGHGAGDALLREIGKMLQTEMRGGDLACRYGGEEFTIILPGASLEHATMIAESLRASVRFVKAEFNGKVVGEISCSLGVASYPLHGTSWQTVLHAADTALLQAKHTRDRVVVYEMSSVI